MNYIKIYNGIIKHRQTNTPIGYTERHHIIPRSIGGLDDSSNIVELTAREHFICHWILLKIQAYKSKEYYKMLRAFLMMVQCKSINQDRYITSRKYETLKKEYNELQSRSNKGEGNSQYGTMWVTHLISKESKKIPKTDILPNGYIKGRILDWDNNFNVRKCFRCGKVGCLSRSNRFCSKECMKYINEPHTNSMAVCGYIPSPRPIKKPRKDTLYFEVNFLERYRDLKCIIKTLESFNKNTKAYYRKGKFIILNSGDDGLIELFKKSCTLIRSNAHKKK